MNMLAGTETPSSPARGFIFIIINVSRLLQSTHIYFVFFFPCSRPQAWNLINYSSVVLMNLLRALENEKFVFVISFPRIFIVTQPVEEEKANWLTSFAVFSLFFCASVIIRERMNIETNKRSHCVDGGKKIEIDLKRFIEKRFSFILILELLEEALIHELRHKKSNFLGSKKVSNIKIWKKRKVYENIHVVWYLCLCTIFVLFGEEFESVFYWINLL